MKMQEEILKHKIDFLVIGIQEILDRLSTKPMQDDELADVCRFLIKEAKR
jgi:hypothetical protein